jgi:hypothetical protein
VGHTCRRSGTDHARRSPNARALALRLWQCPGPIVAGGRRMRSRRRSPTTRPSSTYRIGGGGTNPWTI